MLRFEIMKTDRTSRPSSTASARALAAADIYIYIYIYVMCVYIYIYIYVHTSLSLYIGGMGQAKPFTEDRSSPPRFELFDSSFDSSSSIRALRFELFDSSFDSSFFFEALHRGPEQPSAIRALRAYPLAEVMQTIPCRSIRGNGIPVNSTLPPLLPMTST